MELIYHSLGDLYCRECSNDPITCSNCGNGVIHFCVREIFHKSFGPMKLEEVKCDECGIDYLPDSAE